ncbi:coth protein-domain-containing protein [Immersiella caudata]|uniref:Coth protein-domain-containing protein n=1 Tax=Immersiella caudata TaxID=314043 RepID=A0AA39WYQ8_9PEZI|nr:coth protein-domain-containing protein [Immersiella caudata]
MADQKRQQALTEFYNIDNLVTVNIKMDPADWTSLRNEEPKGGWEHIGRRYSWHMASEVSISGTKWKPSGSSGPPSPLTQVAITKKSFMGSRSSEKPSLRLDFGKNNPQQGQTCEANFGFKTITLNNSIQDRSFVRQTLGYEILRQAGAPYARCNYARVMVNGTDYGVYVNLEPIKKAFLQNNFNNDKGNLYEVEHQEDLNRSTLNANRISFEGFSNFFNCADLHKAVEQIEKGFTAASQVIDITSLSRVLALEALLKHWDGYAIQRNNTYLYNDVVAVEKPDVPNIKLKLIPCGIDQILQSHQDFVVGANGVLASLVLNNPTATAQLRASIRTIADKVFSRANINTSLLPLLSRMESILSQAGALTPDVTKEITSVKKQLRLVRTGAYQLINEFPTPTSPAEATTVVSRTAATVLQASSKAEESEVSLTAEACGVYHAIATHATDPHPSQLWSIVPNPENPKRFQLKNKEYGTVLHAENWVSMSSPDQGRKARWKFFAAGEGTGRDERNLLEMQPVKLGSANGKSEGREWRATGTYHLCQAAGVQFVRFSDEVNARGRTMVVQVVGREGATEVFFG